MTIKVSLMGADGRETDLGNPVEEDATRAIVARGGTLDPGVTTTPADEPPPTPPRAKQRRGFAAMSPEKQRAIAASGGRQCHRLGRGHTWTHEEAVEAGRKGGTASRGGRGKARPAP